MSFVVQILLHLLDILWWVIIIQAILSWLIAFNVLSTHNDIVRQIWFTLDRLTQPLYRPIRRILPDFGGLDLSPMVVLFGILIAREGLARLAPFPLMM
ncbi:MAG: YggT family protein [Chakrabartia sp.]